MRFTFAPSTPAEANSAAAASSSLLRWTSFCSTVTRIALWVTAHPYYAFQCAGTAAGQTERKDQHAVVKVLILRPDLGPPLHAAPARPRLGLRDRFIREHRVQRAAQPGRVPGGVQVVGVRRAAVNQPLLPVEHEDVGR